MSSQPVDFTGHNALPLQRPDAVMDLDGGTDRRANGGPEMVKRAKLRSDRAAAATVTEQLAALEKMNVGQLAARYREVFGVPTRTRNKEYLRKKIGWRIQELAEGGLSESALARIEQLAPLAPVRWRSPLPDAREAVEVVATPKPIPRDPRLPPPGSTVMRVHHGVEHRVTVHEQDFEYKGQRYQSLSQIARLISNTPWNGFLFFGLQRRTKADQPAKAEGVPA